MTESGRVDWGNGCRDQARPFTSYQQCHGQPWPAAQIKAWIMLTPQCLRGGGSERQLRKRREHGDDEIQRRRCISGTMTTDGSRGEVRADHFMFAMTATFMMARFRLLFVLVGLIEAAVAVIESGHFRRAEAVAHIRPAPAHRLGGEQQDHQDHAGESVDALAHERRNCAVAKGTCQTSRALPHKRGRCGGRCFPCR